MVNISLDVIIAERMNVALRLGCTMRVYCWPCQVKADCFGGLPMGAEKGLLKPVGSGCILSRGPRGFAPVKVAHLAATAI